MKSVLGILALSSLLLGLEAEAAEPPLIVAQGLPGRLPGTLPGQQPAAAPKPAPAASGPEGLAACCDITTIDKAKNLVSARERGSGRIVEFKVADSAVLQRLKVGQDVYANFRTKQVSVDGKALCCTITSVAAGSPTVASKTSGQSLAPVAKAPPRTEAPKVAQLPVKSPGKASGAPSSRPQDPPDDDANEDDDPDPPKTLRQKGPRGGASGRAVGGNIVRLDKYPDAQGFLKKVADTMAKKEMDVSLIGGEKYMINKCLGIKVRAGNFKMKLASPNARLEGTAAKLTFRVEHIALNGISLRMRPSTNILKPCHFGKKFSVGGSAKDVKVEYRFDPVMDLKQCKFTTLGAVKTRVDVGNLNLKPLQNNLDNIAKNAFEDAVNNFFNGDDPFKIIDDVFEADCPGKKA